MPEFMLQRERKQTRYFPEPLSVEVHLDMVLVPGGDFTMGSPEDEPERLDNEGPQRTVKVPAFFMGRYPVTQAQWRFVAQLPPVNQKLARDPAEFKGHNRPVETVSWYDAVEFCQRLAQHTGRPYRLPTEAEWEYACRAGTTTPFYFGETITPEIANYNGADEKYGAYGRGPKGEYRRETTPVDHFGIANGFGLCDMHGNVWEWCQDHYHASYEGAPTNGSAWEYKEADENESRILRGGAWGTFPRLCRSAYRFYVTPRGSVHGIGFRLVCGAPRALQ